MAKVASHKFVEKTVEFWKDKLNLNHWTILLCYKEDTEEDDNSVTLAYIQVFEKRYVARINLSSQVMETGKKRLEWVILHELLHIYSNDIKEHIMPLIIRASQDTYDAVESSLHFDIENMTDALTTAFLKSVGKTDLDYFRAEGEE